MQVVSRLKTAYGTGGTGRSDDCLLGAFGDLFVIFGVPTVSPALSLDH